MTQYSREYLQLINSWQWEIIRSLVFKRDNYTCQTCRRRITKQTRKLHLQCDHVVYPPKGAPIEAFFAQPLDQYQTLCNHCHNRKTTEGKASNGATKTQRSRSK